MKFRIDKTGAPGFMYVGWADPNFAAVEGAAVWRILRCTIDASDDITAGDWADGDTMFDNVWNDRAVLTYV